MTTQTSELTVHRTVTVAVPQARAFEVFTARFDSWWPREHHIAPVPMAEAIIEPKVGGRWMERGTDGTECEWGRVLAWEPPTRVLLSWHLNGDFQYDPDPARSSEVEVTFTSEGPKQTRVDLKHRHLERHVKGVELHRGVSDKGGWGELLQKYAAVV